MHVCIHHTEDDVVTGDCQELVEDCLDGRHGGGDERHDLVGQEVGLVLVGEHCGRVAGVRCACVKRCARRYACEQRCAIPKSIVCGAYCVMLCGVMASGCWKH